MTPSGVADRGAPVRGILRWQDASGRQEAFLCEGDTAQIGRGPDNDVVIASGHVSRHHAVITWREDGFEVADLGSMNGTLVNGQRVELAQLLADGDVIRLYDIEMTYEAVGQDDPQPEPSPDADRTFQVLPTAPQPRLIISAGPQEGREIILTGGKMTIGRATSREAFDIPLQDRAISRPHAEIEQTPEGYVVTDLGSANGTLVNGGFIEEPVALRDGDVIMLGETTLLFRGR
jgi:pSer/pThr/pTyr-binding forkhead associated (FHA) protein